MSHDIETDGLAAKTIEDGQTLDEQTAATVRRLRPGPSEHQDGYGAGTTEVPFPLAES